MSHTPKIPGINVFDSLTMGGDVKMVGLPTADPQVEDKLWNDNGGIKVSAGTLAFNISTRDTEENIITTSPTNPEGEYTIAYGTDTQDLYVWNGSVWYKFTDDFFSNVYSLDFDGTNDYLDLGTTTYFDTSTALTVSGWVKMDVHTLYPMFISLKTSASTGWKIGFSTDSSYSPIFIGSNSNFVRLKGGSSQLLTNTWYHIAVTYNGNGTTTAGNYKLYVNGSEQTLSGAGAFAATANVSYIGRDSGGNYLNGQFDEVSIFKSELSSSIISSIYNSGTPNDISSLSPYSWWRMGDDDSGTGTTITDQGSGGNNGTLTNGPTFSTTIPS